MTELLTTEPIDVQDIDRMLDETGRGPEAVIPILQAIQSAGAQHIYALGDEHVLDWYPEAQDIHEARMLAALPHASSKHLRSSRATARVCQSPPARSHAKQPPKPGLASGR